MKKFLSLALALLLLAVMLPVVSMAAGLSGANQLPAGFSEFSEGMTVVDENRVQYASIEAALKDANRGNILYCKASAAISVGTHTPVTKDVTIYGNGATFAGDFSLGSNSIRSLPDGVTSGNVEIFNAKNVTVWGNPFADNTTWTVTIKDCENTDAMFVMYRGNESATSKMNLTIENSKATGHNATDDIGVHLTCGGSVVIKDCEFVNGSYGININHKQNDALTINISNNTFNGCGLENPSNDYFAPVRIANAAEGTSVTATIEDNTFINTVAKGSNGDIRLGDQRTENGDPKPSYDVSATIKTNEDITVKSGSASTPATDPATVSAGSKVTAKADGTIKKEGPTTIVIISPTQDTPKTDDQKNPATGANDLVAVAVAAAALALAGSAIILRKD